MVKHFNLKITGRVQGVWYRASARRKAEELGLCGFVKNLPDGGVYAEAEGPEDRLQAFVRWCWDGPELANVANVEVKEGEVQGFERFEVER
jgi:acylphosphatase